jgi:hypothetical protein
MHYRDFWEAGHQVFGLHGRGPDGKCECGNPHCPEKSLFKHPRVSNWQHTPHWSEEQLDTMELMGQFRTGYGVLLRDMLTVDVDARNGGLSSLELLLEDYPGIAAAGLIVNTGSGGGSKHYFFKVPVGVSLVTKLEKYPGIDFKSGAAFVVGPGSMHASGNRYEIALGSPADIDDAPADLIEALRVPEKHRADIGGQTVDVSHGDLAEMLSYIPNDDLDYDQWIKIGMALHHASGGSAYGVWDAWSQKSKKYDETSMPYKWHSFGRSANPVTLGTLAHYAEQNGWTQPVTFVPDVEFDFTPYEAKDSIDIDTAGVDLLRPPGLAGQVATWIESRTRRKREQLAAMAAIAAIGNICGLRYIDDLDRSTTNLFIFNVAGSGTGKEAVQDCIREIMVVCGMAEAVHGTIKSEQEVMRNLLRHQPAFFLIDEIGFLLQKIKSAQKRGGATYLEGIIGILMSAYSKADGNMILSGDAKDEIKAELRKELVKIDKQLDELGEKPYLIKRKASVEYQLRTIGQGLPRPFLSLSGYTTPENFDELVDYQSAANGFIARAILCIETETAPETKDDWVKHDLPENLKITLQQLSMGGSFDMVETFDARVEYYGEKIVIPTAPKAKDMLRRARKLFDKMAYEHKTLSGLEALPNRGYEQVSKVSLILAIPEGVRTEEHVRWAYALIKRDIESKMHLVTGNERAVDNPAMALRSKIRQLLIGPEGETLGVIVNRLRKYKREDIEKCLAKMEEANLITTEEDIHKFNKKPIKRFKIKE